MCVPVTFAQIHSAGIERSPRPSGLTFFFHSRGCGLHPCQRPNLTHSGWHFSRTWHLEDLRFLGVGISSATGQDFYEEKLTNDYREARFWEIAKKEGMAYAKFQRYMQDKKVILS